MVEVRITKEKLAERCEICHQKDCFDAVKNYCYRCEKINELGFEEKHKTTERFIKFIPTLQEIRFQVQQDNRFSLLSNPDTPSWKILFYFAQTYVSPLFRVSLIAEILVYLLFVITIALIGYFILSHSEAVAFMFGLFIAGLFMLVLMLPAILILGGILFILQKDRQRRYASLNENASEDE
jgi:ABC-type multidrug transport system fused ATPase/permease subunit